LTNFATLQITPSPSKFLLSKLQNHTFEMTKSNTSSESSKSLAKTTRISVKPWYFNKTIKSSSSSSSDVIRGNRTRLYLSRDLEKLTTPTRQCT
jgi:outer membrane usher protein FimD/PapC